MADIILLFRAAHLGLGTAENVDLITMAIITASILLLKGLARLHAYVAVLSVIMPKTNLANNLSSIENKVQFKSNPRRRKAFPLISAFWPTGIDIFGTEDYFFSPYARSPASPRPGTMYEWLVSSSSMAATQRVTPSSGRCFWRYSTA